MVILWFRWRTSSTGVLEPFGFPRLKPWTYGVASRRKLKTWVYLRLRLAMACAYLRWLAMTCAHFGRDRICTKVKATFSPFGHTTQVNASWVTSMNLLLAKEIEDSLPKNTFLWLACTWKETCESVWPPIASLYASSTCVHFRLLAGPFGQGLTPVNALIASWKKILIQQSAFHLISNTLCKFPD